MTDFVKHVLSPENPDWIIRSLEDVDYYKHTMGYFINRFYPETEVTFSFMNRHKHIPLGTLVDEGELRAQLDHVRTLRGVPLAVNSVFPKEHRDFMSQLQLPPYTLKRDGDQYDLKSSGLWKVSTYWETIFVSVVNELLTRKVLRNFAKHFGEDALRELYQRAEQKLFQKLVLLKANDVHFSDFGLRRRHSFLWQRHAVEMARDVMGPNFIGTSSAYLARLLELRAIGTNAHELPMVLTALADGDEAKRDAQYEVVRKWQQLFSQQNLRILLPDAYGSRQFFAGMPKDLARQVAHEWGGMRGDSGDMEEEGNLYIRWLISQGVNPRDKSYVPSDGLDVKSMLALNSAFADRIKRIFGWGTKLTNDFEDCHPRANELAVIDGVVLPLTWNQLLSGHSIVCKVITANGRPAVKLSNNFNKATGPKEVVAEYVRIYGNLGRISQKVDV